MIDRHIGIMQVNRGGLPKLTHFPIERMEIGPNIGRKVMQRPGSDAR